MDYIFILIAILISIIWLFVLGWNLVYATGRCIFVHNYKCPIKSIIFSVILIFGCIFYYKHLEANHRLSFVPTKLQVKNIFYAKEESWGFGPGGNETGLIVYELPDEVAKEIDRVGINYFSTIPPLTINTDDWHGRYWEWKPTPILSDPSWAYPEADDDTVSESSPQSISNLLGQRGFGISIEPDIEREINKAISIPGSFFAYGRIGVIIVIPKIGKVVIAYN